MDVMFFFHHSWEYNGNSTIHGNSTIKVCVPMKDVFGCFKRQTRDIDHMSKFHSYEIHSLDHIPPLNHRNLAQSVIVI